MRVLVCGWIGSTNLGDELVFAGVRRLLAPLGAQVAAVSVDPERTRRLHGVAALDHRRLDRIAAAARRADLVVWGGGGLVQDETSPFNLPYHLSRAWTASLVGTPWVGLGLGVGPLRTVAGRRLATTLRRAAAVTVRDEPSLALLDALAVPATLTADVALHLGEPAPSAPDPVAVVSLRPWSGSGGGRLPVGWRRGHDEPGWFVPTIAAALDRLVADVGLAVRFVALQPDRDDPLHRRVATAMRAPAECRTPGLDEVLGEVARGRLVVAMRYHAGIAATLAGRPAVLIGYSPKVDALARELGAGAAHLPFEAGALARVGDAAVTLLGHGEASAAVAAARDRLVARGRGDRLALDLAATGRPRS
jgi:polysaccharide pyruvyl transferase CsaB